VAHGGGPICTTMQPPLYCRKRRAWNYWTFRGLRCSHGPPVVDEEYSEVQHRHAQDLIKPSPVSFSHIIQNLLGRAAEDGSLDGHIPVPS
jgi:hypothetical protein